MEPVGEPGHVLAGDLSYVREELLPDEQSRYLAAAGGRGRPYHVRRLRPPDLGDGGDELTGLGADAADGVIHRTLAVGFPSQRGEILFRGEEFSSGREAQEVRRGL